MTTDGIIADSIGADARESLGFMFPPRYLSTSKKNRSSRGATIRIAREHGCLTHIVEVQVEEYQPLEPNTPSAMRWHPEAHRVDVRRERCNRQPLGFDRPDKKGVEPLPLWCDANLARQKAIMAEK